MKEWLRETHGPGFELLRHFLLHFFDSDLVTTSGQTGPALAGALSIFVPMFPLIEQPLRHKYAYLSHLAVPGPYRLAVRADELWLITLMMSAIGLLTAIKWQALFPGLRDYRTLGSLPLRAWQIFAAKLSALFLVATAAMVTLNLVPDRCGSPAGVGALASAGVVPGALPEPVGRSGPGDAGAGATRARRTGDCAGVGDVDLQI